MGTGGYIVMVGQDLANFVQGIQNDHRKRAAKVLKLEIQFERIFTVLCLSI